MTTKTKIIFKQILIFNYSSKKINQRKVRKYEISFLNIYFNLWLPLRVINNNFYVKIITIKYAYFKLGLLHFMISNLFSNEFMF